MNKRFFALLIAVLLIQAGTYSFAQSGEAGIQGEWKLIQVQQGSQVIDMTQSPYVESRELIWKFEGTNFKVLAKNLQEGKTDTATNTFTLTDNLIVVPSEGQNMPYTFQGNILTVTMDDIIMVFRKK